MGRGARWLGLPSLICLRWIVRWSSVLSCAKDHPLFASRAPGCQTWRSISAHRCARRRLVADGCQPRHRGAQRLAQKPWLMWLLRLRLKLVRPLLFKGRPPMLPCCYRFTVVGRSPKPSCWVMLLFNILGPLACRPWLNGFAEQTGAKLGFLTESANTVGARTAGWCSAAKWWSERRPNVVGAVVSGCAVAER